MMYKDRATVRSAQKILAEDGSDDYDEDYVVVYEKIPCKLSQYGKEMPAHIEDRAMILGVDLRLCCDPEYDIRPNDVLEVSHRGQLFTLHTGQRFAYPTHQEISVRRKKEAGHGD